VLRAPSGPGAGVERREARLLGVLRARGPCTTAQIAARLGWPARVVRRYAERLEASGRIERRGGVMALSRTPAPAPGGSDARPRDTANAPLLAPAPLPAPPPAPVGAPPWGAGWVVSPDGGLTIDFAGHEASRAEAEARRRRLAAAAEAEHAGWVDVALVAVVVAAATEDVSALDAAAGEAGRRLARQARGACGCDACRRRGAFVGLPPTWAPPPPGAIVTRLAAAADLAVSRWPDPRLRALSKDLWLRAGQAALADVQEREARALSEARSIARSLAMRYST
jgi:DNA-binding Lrp family transcriptional regulator